MGRAVVVGVTKAETDVFDDADVHEDIDDDGLGRDDTDRVVVKLDDGAVHPEGDRE